MTSAGRGQHGNEKNNALIWEPLQGKIKIHNGRHFSGVRQVLTQTKT